MQYIAKNRLRVVMGLFFGSGILGITVGLYQNFFMFTLMGTVNLCLGGFFGWLYLTQVPPSKEGKKRERKS